MGSRAIGLIVSSTMIFISISIMVIEKAITAEAWGLLLLTPLPIAISLSKNTPAVSIGGSSRDDWEDTEFEEESDGVGDPLDAGFDLPVL